MSLFRYSGKDTTSEQDPNSTPQNLPNQISQSSFIGQQLLPYNSALPNGNSYTPQVYQMSVMTQSSPGDAVTSPGIIPQTPTNGPVSEPGIVSPAFPVGPVTLPGVGTQSLTGGPISLSGIDGSMSSVVKRTVPLRQPVVIRGTGKKSSGLKRPPEGRRLVIHTSVAVLLVFIVLGALFTVIPTGPDSHGLGIFGQPFKPSNNIVKTNSNNTGLVAQQAATATAVTQDGFDPGAGQTYVGVPVAPPGYGGNGNHFFYGQCTYWASMRYHNLTGRWVPWLGNANQWVAGAYANGWHVSSTPHMHSIIVLQAYVQGSSFYGHVAIVEGIDGSTVHTSNWNWGYGGWARMTMVDFHVGTGVNFVWYGDD